MKIRFMKLYIHVIKLCFFSILLIQASCKSIALSNSDFKTDLGAVGNEKIVSSISQYAKKSQHCSSAGQGKRVLLTGFGLFSSPPRDPQGIAYNISGILSQAFTDSRVTVTTVDKDHSPLNGSYRNSYLSSLSHMPKNSYGGYARQRELTINGKKVVVCSVLLDVLWDQAAGIIAYETSMFKPDVVILTGKGAAQAGIFEGGAINMAIPVTGYEFDGSVDENNLPVNDPYSRNYPEILPSSDPGVEGLVLMKWNAEKLSYAANLVLKKYSSSRRTRFETGARASNNYICNNVSYVTLSALSGVEARLAGGNFIIRAADSSVIKKSGSALELSIDNKTIEKVRSIGFFHLPTDVGSKGSEAEPWLAVFAEVIDQI